MPFQALIATTFAFLSKVSLFSASVQAVSIGPWSFNGFDVVVLVLLLISALYAMARGFLREIISIGALLFSLIVTLFVYGQFRFAARDFITPNWLADGALILGAGALSYFIAAIVLAKIGKTITGDEPGLIDRLMGGGFGIFRGLVVAALFVMITTANYRASLEASELRDYIAANPGAMSPQVIERMPRSMREQLDAEPQALPLMYQNSTFYPVLENIGGFIRALPFAKARTYADRIKAGDFDSLIEDIR